MKLMKLRPKLPQHKSLKSWGSLSTKIKILHLGPHWDNYSKTVFYEVNLALHTKFTFRFAFNK